VQRTDRLSFPGKPSSDYRWIIMQIDLTTDNIPHVFMDANHYDETFFANLFVKHTRMQSYNQFFLASAYQHTFADTFNVYGQPDLLAHIYEVITPEIAATLVTHFHHFDFEIEDDKLLVYSFAHLPTPQALDHMLRIGLWLGEHLSRLHIEK
jgi:hypothetical protein